MKQPLDAILIIISLTIITLGCSREEVNHDIFDIPSGTVFDIVLEGFISSEKTHYQVKLSKPTDFSTRVLSPINNANVALTDGDKFYEFELTSVPGVFQSKNRIAGEVGKRYTLIVNYDGKTYYASDSLVQVQHEMNIASYAIEVHNGFFSFDFNQHNFGFDIPSVWIPNGNTDENGKIIKFDIKDLLGIELYNHVGSIPQGVFPTRWRSTGTSGFSTDSLEIIQMSLSTPYYDYLLSQFNIREWSSGIFSTIPGNTKTNVSEGGTGFFNCMDVKRHRLSYGDLYDYFNE